MNPETQGSAELPAADSLATQETVTADASQLTIHIPVDARGVALGILATLALVFALQWAQSFAISLGIPIIFIAKVISQHVEQLHPVAELLGE